MAVSSGLFAELEWDNPCVVSGSLQRMCFKKLGSIKREYFGGDGRSSSCRVFMSSFGVQDALTLLQACRVKSACSRMRSSMFLHQAYKCHWASPPQLMKGGTPEMMVGDGREDIGMHLYKYSFLSWQLCLNEALTFTFQTVGL